jgi:hypothetical protein
MRFYKRIKAEAISLRLASKIYMRINIPFV